MLEDMEIEIYGVKKEKYLFYYFGVFYLYFYAYYDCCYLISLSF